jgi:hypothetical protein
MSQASDDMNNMAGLPDVGKRSRSSYGVTLKKSKKANNKEAFEKALQLSVLTLGNNKEYYRHVKVYVNELLTQLQQYPVTSSKIHEAVENGKIIYNSINAYLDTMLDGNPTISENNIEIFIMAPFDAINNTYYNAMNEKEIVPLEHQGIYYHKAYKLGWFPCVIRAAEKTGTIHIFPLEMNGDRSGLRQLNFIGLPLEAARIKHYQLCVNWIANFPGPSYTSDVANEDLQKIYGWYDDNYERPGLEPRLKPLPSKSLSKRPATNSPGSNGNDVQPKDKKTKGKRRKTDPVAPAAQAAPSEPAVADEKNAKLYDTVFDALKAKTLDPVYQRYMEEYVNNLSVVNDIDGKQAEYLQFIKEELGLLPRSDKNGNQFMVGNAKRILFWEPLSNYTIGYLWNKKNQYSENAVKDTARALLRVCRSIPTSFTHVKWLPCVITKGATVTKANVRNGSLSHINVYPLIQNADEPLGTVSLKEFDKFMKDYPSPSSDPKEVDPYYLDVYMFHRLQPPMMPSPKRQSSAAKVVDVPVDVEYKQLLSIADTIHDFHYLGSATAPTSELRKFNTFLRSKVIPDLKSYFGKISSKFDSNWLNTFTHVTNGQKIEKYMMSTFEKDLNFLPLSALGASQNQTFAYEFKDALETIDLSKDPYVVIKLGVKPSSQAGVTRAVSGFYREPNEIKQIENLTKLFNKLFGVSYRLVVDQGSQVPHTLLNGKSPGHIVYTGASLYDGSASASSGKTIDPIPIGVSKTAGDLFRLNKIIVHAPPQTGSARVSKFEAYIEGNNALDKKVHDMYNDNWRTECRPNIGKGKEEKVTTSINRLKICAPPSITDVDLHWFVFDSKRSGDYLQVVGCQELNKDAANKGNCVFVTHDHLAVLYARLLKQPVIYTEKDQGGCVYLHVFRHNSNYIFQQGEKIYTDMINTLKHVFGLIESVSQGIKSSPTNVMKDWESYKNAFTKAIEKLCLQVDMNKVNRSSSPPTDLHMLIILLCIDLMSVHQKLSKNLSVLLSVMDDYEFNTSTFQLYHNMPYSSVNYENLSQYFKKFKSIATNHMDKLRDGDDVDADNIILYDFATLNSHFQALVTIKSSIENFYNADEIYQIVGNQALLQTPEHILRKHFQTLLIGIDNEFKKIASKDVTPLFDIEPYLKAFLALSPVSYAPGTAADDAEMRQEKRTYVQDRVMDAVAIREIEDIKEAMKQRDDRGQPKTLIGFKNKFLSGGGNPSSLDRDKVYNNRYTFAMYLYEAHPQRLPMYLMYLYNMNVPSKYTRIFQRFSFTSAESLLRTAYMKRENITEPFTLPMYLSYMSNIRSDFSNPKPHAPRALMPYTFKQKVRKQPVPQPIKKRPRLISIHQLQNALAHANEKVAQTRRPSKVSSWAVPIDVKGGSADKKKTHNKN